MNWDTKEAFTLIKPACDGVMMNPSDESIEAFTSRLSSLKKEAVQELQQYLMFPFITHVSSTELEKNYELLSTMIDAMRIVLEKVTVNSLEMCLKIEKALLTLIFDSNSPPGMIADVPEELKHSVLRTLTVLMLNLDKRFREKLLITQMPLLAQVIFVAVHIAKLERLRALRLAAIDCVTAHTATHALLTNSKCHLTDINIERAAVTFLAGILPGVLAALLDVATCSNNPGHAVIVAAIDGIHRILCMAMNDKNLKTRPDIPRDDITRIVVERAKMMDTDVSSQVSEEPKEPPMNSLEWYARAGMKLTLITKSLAPLRIHDHCLVRKELAVFCHRLLLECHTTMLPSVPIVLDVLISLEKDEYPAVSEYCTSAINWYFQSPHKYKAMDGLCDNLMAELNGLPRLMNNIEFLNLMASEPPVVKNEREKRSMPWWSKKLAAMRAVMTTFKRRIRCAAPIRRPSVVAAYLEKKETYENELKRAQMEYWEFCRKEKIKDACIRLSALNLVHGYIKVMCDDSRPQLITMSLSVHASMECLCSALTEAASVYTDLTMMTQHSVRDVLSPPPKDSPWCRFRHCDTPELQATLADTCAMLSRAECADLIFDRLLELFQGQRRCEHACLINWFVGGENSIESLSHRVLAAYLSDVWHLPLEVVGGELPLTSYDTLDVTVYNPRAWHKDSVPGLYEGTTETRYTGISYQKPRQAPPRDPNSCSTLKEAQHNMALSCLLTEGVGVAAKRLGEAFQPYLLKSLTLLLERVGSKYEMLHLAGLKAINDVAAACSHANVAELIRCNADYFTNQITHRLKKAWDSESALQILSVVMEYSDSSILDCLYGIVEDVLMQSCDKYYERNVQSYLQVFVTFIACIRRWFPLPENTKNNSSDVEIDVLKDLKDHIKSKKECERLMSQEEFEKSTGKSVEEMYREDLKKKEDDILDYDDKVTEEKLPLPQHVKVTISIIKRCVHFVPSLRREVSIVAMRVLTTALPVLAPYEDELLPLIHVCWSPLVVVFENAEPVVLKRALELLHVMAELAKDFILSRAVKEILPHIYKFLLKSAPHSLLKDTGSSYRSSHAYSLQVAALTALPNLAVDLRLEDNSLEDAMDCVDAYLSNKQPKPLQALAVDFFKKIKEYDYGATWHHIRKHCDNDMALEPPDVKHMELKTIFGTPFEATNKDYNANIKLIFNPEIS